MIHRVKQIGVMRIILTIYFAFLCGISGAVVGWDINESVFWTLLAFILGIATGGVAVDTAFKVQGKITLEMVIGTAIGAFLAILFFINSTSGFNKEQAGSEFFTLALGSSLGLFTGADIDDAKQRAKKGALWGALIGIVFAVGYFVITTLISIWARDISKVLTDLIFAIKLFFFFLLTLPISGAVIYAPLSVILDSFILDFARPRTEEETVNE